MNASSSSITESPSANHTSGAKITKPEPLFPGCRHVETFGHDEDYEDAGLDDKLESYVTLDLGSVDQTLVPSSSSYRLIVS